MGQSRELLRIVRFPAISRPENRVPDFLGRRRDRLDWALNWSPASTLHAVSFFHGNSLPSMPLASKIICSSVSRSRTLCRPENSVT